MTKPDYPVVRTAGNDTEPLVERTTSPGPVLHHDPTGLATITGTAHNGNAE